MKVVVRKLNEKIDQHIRLAMKSVYFHVKLNVTIEHCSFVVNVKT